MSTALGLAVLVLIWLMLIGLARLLLSFAQRLEHLAAIANDSKDRAEPLEPSHKRVEKSRKAA